MSAPGYSYSEAKAVLIAKYAAEHTRDCGGDRARALREMDNEPGEVALACDCFVSEVQDWIDREQRAQELLRDDEEAEESPRIPPELLDRGY